MTNPSAYVDTLVLGSQIGDLVDGFTRPELHLFAYAACLLSIYEGQPASEWGYEFVSTEHGLPFSQDIDESIETGVELGWLKAGESLFQITPEGEEELHLLRQMETSQARKRYLGGATDALLVFNPGNIREAFCYDPTINYLRRGKRTAWMLTDGVVERLYTNFQQLRAALAYDARDLSVPMVSWLHYLLQTGRSAGL